MDLVEIQKIIEQGKAKKQTAHSGARKQIEDRLPLFRECCIALEKALDELLGELGKKLPLTIEKRGTVDGFLEMVRQPEELRPVYQTIPLNFRFGEGKHMFGNGMSYLLYTAEQVKLQSSFAIFENQPIIHISIIGSNDNLLRKKKAWSFYLVPQDRNEFLLYPDELSNPRRVHLKDLMAEIKQRLTDPEVWKIIYE